MPGNSFGTIFKLSNFGESHGPAIGGIIEGCPAGLTIDLGTIQQELSRRRPGQSIVTTERNEKDEVEFLSGIFDNVTTGSPIGFVIRNTDHRSKDYEQLKDLYRPSHADFTYEAKYGWRDHRGGGRSSARETATRIVAGAIAKQILLKQNIIIQAFVKQVGAVKLDKNFDELDLHLTEKSMVRCPDTNTSEKMIEAIEIVKKQGDTLGGVIQCVALNLPVGLGEPVFDKLPALLSHAMLSINAAKGFEIGAGFSFADKKGSEMNDAFFMSDNNKIKTKTNYSGGVQGGISNGMPLYFNVVFKPVSTVKIKQETINRAGTKEDFTTEGRHDPCVVPRAVPIVEAMAALVLTDCLLLARCSRL